MVLRPVDPSGDILPVLNGNARLSGAEAVARLAEYRLDLYTGDWWENPSRGNEILELLRESRLTEADGQALASAVAAYIRETPGVTEVRDLQCAVTDKRFVFSCTVDTEYGPAAVQYEL